MSRFALRLSTFASIALLLLSACPPVYNRVPTLPTRSAAPPSPVPLTGSP